MVAEDIVNLVLRDRALLELNNLEEAIKGIMVVKGMETVMDRAAIIHKVFIRGMELTAPIYNNLLFILVVIEGYLLLGNYNSLIKWIIGLKHKNYLWRFECVDNESSMLFA